MRRTGEGGMLWPRVNCDVTAPERARPLACAHASRTLRSAAVSELVRFVVRLSGRLSHFQQKATRGVRRVHRGELRMSSCFRGDARLLDFRTRQKDTFGVRTERATRQALPRASFSSGENEEARR
jgi:hypothetical protein